MVHAGGTHNHNYGKSKTEVGYQKAKYAGDRSIGKFKQQKATRRLADCLSLGKNTPRQFVAVAVLVDVEVVAVLSSSDAAATAIAIAAATATPAAIAPALKPPPLPSLWPAVTPVVVPLPVFAACDCAKANVGAAARAIAKPSAVIVLLTTIAEDLQMKTRKNLSDFTNIRQSLSATSKNLYSDATHST